MFNFEQRKLIAQLERDMKKLGLKVDYSELVSDQLIQFGVDGFSKITIWLFNGCFLSLDLNDNEQFTKVAVKALYIANKFMKDYRKISVEVPA